MMTAKLSGGARILDLRLSKPEFAKAYDTYARIRVDESSPFLELDIGRAKFPTVTETNLWRKTSTDHSKWDKIIFRILVFL